MKSSWRWTPDSRDSGGYGTRMRSGRSLPTGGAWPGLAAEYCHLPLRFCHCWRVICGRGYSGKGRVCETSFAQGVVIWYVELLMTYTLKAGTAEPSAAVMPP